MRFRILGIYNDRVCIEYNNEFYVEVVPNFIIGDGSPEAACSMCCISNRIQTCEVFKLNKYICPAMWNHQAYFKKGTPEGGV